MVGEWKLLHSSNRPLNPWQPLGNPKSFTIKLLKLGNKFILELQYTIILFNQCLVCFLKNAYTLIKTCTNFIFPFTMGPCTKNIKIWNSYTQITRENEVEHYEVLDDGNLTLDLATWRRHDRACITFSTQITGDNEVEHY